MSYINQITGIELNHAKLPKNHLLSKNVDAVNYRRAFARANNAIEGVILSTEDKNFMNNIPVGMPKAEFKQAVLKHLK